MLKVSPKNNGSQHLVAGTEALAPGATLPKHRHLAQDEIVLIHSGTAHVWLGDQERDLHAGGLGSVPMFFKLTQVLDGMNTSPDQQKECAHLGHAESASRPELPQK
jgi:hypothetical protein